MAEPEQADDNLPPADSAPVPRPRWERPELTVLDVERGTMTTTGPVSDGNGSTS